MSKRPAQSSSTSSKKRSVVAERETPFDVEIVGEKVVLKNIDKETKQIMEKIGFNDPACLLMFDHENLHAIIEYLNGLGGPLPAWITVPATGESLKLNIVTVISMRANAGGVVGNTLIAPNTFSQYARVVTQLAFLGLEPIFQGVAAGNLPLARNYAFADRRQQTTGVADPVGAPPNGVHLIA